VNYNAAPGIEGSITEEAEFVEFEKLEALSNKEPTLTVRSDKSTIR
jgi:hypothetical protein